MSGLTAALRRLCIARATLILVLTIASGAACAAEIVVFAAASLKEALDEAAKAYAGQTGEAPRIRGKAVRFSASA
jgi:molybdate transport system substrate-binding protein